MDIQQVITPRINYQNTGSIYPLVGNYSQSFMPAAVATSSLQNHNEHLQDAERLRSQSQDMLTRSRLLLQSTMRNSNVQNAPLVSYSVPMYQSQVLNSSYIPSTQRLPHSQDLPSAQLSKSQRELSAFLWMSVMILGIGLAIFGIICLLFYSNSQSKTIQSANTVLLHVYDNLQAAPIYNIEDAAPSSQNNQNIQQTCDSGYSALQLLQWEGVHSGCVCQNARIVAEECSLYHKYIANCLKIEKLPPQRLYAWQNPSNTFCAGVSGQWMSCAASAPITLTHCTTDYCSIGQAPCFSTAASCTANNAVVYQLKNAAQHLTHHHNSLFYTNPTSFTVSSQGKCQLNYATGAANNQTFRPIVGLVVSNNESRICLNPLLLPQKQMQYPLLVQRADGCDEYVSYKLRLNPFNTTCSSTDITNLKYTVDMNNATQHQQQLLIWTILIVGIILFAISAFATYQIQYGQAKHQIFFIQNIQTIILIVILALSAVFGLHLWFAYQKNSLDGGVAIQDYIKYNCFDLNGVVLAITRVSEQSNSLLSRFKYGILAVSLSILAAAVLQVRIHFTS